MLQDPEIIIHRLRLRYLSQTQDGVGERIIDFSKTKTNTPAFKIAGGDPSVMDRCVSPDIPTQDSNEPSHAGMLRSDLASPVSTQLSDDIVAGEPLRRTITDLSLHSRRSRNNLKDELSIAKLNPALRDDEASDQSDISDNEVPSAPVLYGSQQKHLLMIDLHKRISEEPKFQKMPVRRRGISDASVSYRAGTLPLPQRPSFSIARTDSDTDLSRPAQQSVFSEGFMPIAVGAPFESPMLGVPVASDTPDGLEDFANQLALFHAADDSDSDDEYDLVDSSVLTNGVLLSPRMANLRGQRPSNVNVSNPSQTSTIDSLPKTKPRPESVFQVTSGLTALIKANESANISPLERTYGIYNGKGDLKPLRLKIYRPTSTMPSKAFDVIIKSTATVLEAIGYALLRYIDDKLEPPLTADQQNPNAWTLRIVEDDGELDEDFPALERTRPVSKFSFDEFAIVEATASQMTENESLTPDPLGMKSALRSVPDLTIQPASNPPSSHGNQNGTYFTVNPEATTGSSSAVTQNAPSVVTVPASVRAPVRAPGASVLLKVKLRPDPTAPIILHAQSTVLDVTTETYLGDVLDQVCQRRNLDKYMFTLRLAGTNVVVPSDRTVESLQGRTELWLVRKRPMDILTDTAASRSMTPNAPIMVPNTYSGSKLAAGEPSSSLSKYIPDIVTTNTYQRWVVWRRQPMSFMGRHERILAIDGEYVHISPSEAKTMFESPKTTSLHVGQIIACKQSRKIPINFKIMIIKAGQTKRYDFEAVRVQEAETIISKIKTLTRNWTSRTNGSRGSRMIS